MQQKQLAAVLVIAVIVAGATPPNRMIDPRTLQQIATVDDRFQSYNVEMAEVIGGNFWKPYGPGGTLPGTPGALGSGVVGQNPNLFQKMPPLDTANPQLRKLAAALGPAYVRVSGTWANSVYFQDSDSPPPASAPTGFNGILTRAQWKGVIDFAQAADARIVSSFTISAGVRDRSGLWTPGEAARWLSYTRAAGGRIAAAEFFNEPTMPVYGGAPEGYDAAAYAQDFAVFRDFIRRTAPDMTIAGPGSVGEGLLIGPAGIPGMIRTNDLLGARPKPAFDVFSYHHYPAASIRCASMGSHTQTTAKDALSERWLSRADISQAFYGALRDRYQPGKPIWITEIADAACGGNPWASTFLDSFRYADTLGRLARAGVEVMFHNTLASSEYGLLAPGTFEPRPNYWTALLWRRLMGPRVLDAGNPVEGLHLYAHCLRGVPGGVALLAINNSPATESALQLPGPSRRWTLSANTPEAREAKLNGRVLTLAAGGDLPAMPPGDQAAGTVRFAPATITFLAVPGASNPQCASPA